MKLLLDTTDFDTSIKIARHLTGEYKGQVTFHCYWNGNLNEKHLLSIFSCYYFNKKHKIILWLENNIKNDFNKEIEKYAEIKYFSLSAEKKSTNFINNFYYNKSVSFYSDVIRYLLLYNYGGIWFDLDCFILRSFDPLFYNYGNEICVYQWANQNHPNGAIYMSLEAKSEKMKKNIEFIIKQNRCWGFQEASLTYDIPLDMLVLPCSWFDGSWIENPYNIKFKSFFDKTNETYNFDNFFKGSFCYHWHSQWNDTVDETSIFSQLKKLIYNI